VRDVLTAWHQQFASKAVAKLYRQTYFQQQPLTSALRKLTNWPHHHKLTKQNAAIIADSRQMP
jgi:hypothetical protein